MVAGITPKIYQVINHLIYLVDFRGNARYHGAIVSNEWLSAYKKLSWNLQPNKPWRWGTAKKRERERNLLTVHSCELTLWLEKSWYCQVIDNIILASLHMTCTSITPQFSSSWPCAYQTIWQSASVTLKIICCPAPINSSNSGGEGVSSSYLKSCFGYSALFSVSLNNTKDSEYFFSFVVTGSHVITSTQMKLKQKQSL